MIYALVPLSALPFLAYGYAHFYLRAVAEDRGRLSLPVPSIDLTRASGQFLPLPEYRDAVPVLQYHGISKGDARDPYSVSQTFFTQQMAMLYGAGFHTISAAQFSRFLAGDSNGLPSRPILITFDDGRLDSYRGADQVFARYRFRATMFVIAGCTDNRFYSHWNELAKMAKSGRWDIQLHSGMGHSLVRYDNRGDKGPFYAFREWNGGRLESFDAYKRRVISDLLNGESQLRTHVLSYKPLAFAVPYGDYGQNESNDGRIAPWLDKYLVSRYGAVLVQNHDSYTRPENDHGTLQRIEVHNTTSVGDLYRRLVGSFRSPLPAGRESMYASVNAGSFAVANDLLRNVWPERGHPPLRLKWPISWKPGDDDPNNDPYWRFQFYSLQPTSNLLWAYEVTRKPTYLARLIAILRSYVAYDRVRPYDRATFDNAHQAAYRAMVLTNTYVKLRALRAMPADLEKSLYESISKLGSALALSDRDHWEWWVNHGFNEAAGLLLIADNFPKMPRAAAWRRLAVQRLAFMLRTNVDANGVDIENSPYYHYYVLGLISQIARWGKAHGEPALGRMYAHAEKRMLAYAAEVVQPDGRLPMLGPRGLRASPPWTRPFTVP